MVRPSRPVALRFSSPVQVTDPYRYNRLTGTGACHFTALLTEMSAPMESEQLRATFETLHNYRDSTSQVGTVIRMLVQLAQLDGPLRMFGGMPSPCDLQVLRLRGAVL